MLFRMTLIFIIFLAISVLPGCSTSDPQGGLATALCWLRPSCVPSQPKSTTPPPKPIPAPSSQKPKPIQKVKSQRRVEKSCLTSAKARVEASKPYLTVSYVEPTTNAKGQDLTNLARTTIYHDLGIGMVKYKDIPATRPQGGGQVQEKVSFSISKGTSIQVTICITATNTRGQEG